MSTQTVDYLTAIEHLPEGAMLCSEQISWDEYEDLLNHLGDRPGYRVSYNKGRLEIMSPLPEHEKFKEMFLFFAHIVSEELAMLLETRGSATYKQKRRSQGVEPDTSFYVQNATALIGKRTIDLDIDPPPDVVVEIDIPSESSSKFPIYAAFGVPEIWRYDGQQAWMYQLGDHHYVVIESSIAFPILTPQALAEFLELSKTHGQSVALAAFRLWVRERKQV
jgi:Uma2 family endonuclease